MRAFTSNQIDMFLNAFGQTIKLIPSGTVFTAIVEAVPVSIDTGNGSLIEGTEHYLSTKLSVQKELEIKPGIQIEIDSIEYTVYNIEDDLSGVVDIYFRETTGQTFAEDY